MPLSQLRQAITRLILPTADLGLREQTVDPLLFPDDLPPILAVNAGQSAAGPKLQALGINGGILPATASEGNTLTNGGTTIGLAVVQIIPANPNRYKVILFNPGGVGAWVGGPNVALNSGIFLVPNAFLTLQTGAAVYGILTSGSTLISWVEESV